jgi:hypothetical protein
MFTNYYILSYAQSTADKPVRLALETLKERSYSFKSIKIVVIVANAIVLLRMLFLFTR